MNKFEKKRIEQARRETSLKTMYFNRFLFIRYIMAFFFFTNIYWVCCLIMSNSIYLLIPGINLVFMVLAVWEQCKMYSSPINDAKNTVIAYKIIMGINIFIIITLITPIFNKLFPFLNNNIKSHMLILGVVFGGIVLSGISLRKLKMIRDCTDKQYMYVKQLEKKFN